MDNYQYYYNNNNNVKIKRDKNNKYKNNKLNDLVIRGREKRISQI